MGKVLWLLVFLFSLAKILLLSQTARGAEVELGKAEVELGQVVVTATRTEVEISDSPQPISVITKEEIMNTPDRTIPEIIQRVAGVQINQNGPIGSISSAQIRGSEAQQVLIMIDGRRINDAQNGEFDLSNLPLTKDEIERIEVLRGGASALYGSDAMGGVINIITKSPSKDPSARVSSSFGRFGTQEYSLSTSWKPGALGYGLFASGGRSDGYLPNSDYQGGTLGGRVYYDLPWKGELTLSGRNIQKEIGVPGPITMPAPSDREKDNVTQLDLNYRDKIGSNVTLDFKGWQNIYRQNFNPGNPGPDVGPPTVNKTYTTGGNFQATASIGTANLVTGGVEAIQNRIDSSAAGIHEGTTGAFYVQDQIEVAKPLTATLGLRYDANSLFQNQLDPRAALLYRLPWEIRVRASVARSYRAPTFNDLFWPASAFTAGNPNLQPEKAWSYELGGEKKFGDLAIFKVAGFYRDVTNLILWAPGADYVWRPSNILSAHIWGAETELVFHPWKGLSIPLNYSYLYPRDQSAGGPITDKPKHIINAGVEYVTPYRLKVALKGRYVQYYVNSGSTLNQMYFVVDARLSYEFKVYQKFKGEGFVSLTNAFDRHYQINEGYPMPPQSLNGGVAIAF
ncbi:MAG: TonB-dependent receptor [Thermodesulfobacteriota bacterium]|jgi:outer membrane cobalamin receptor